MTLLDVYEKRCRTNSDIAAHLPRLYAEAAVGDAWVIELGVRTGNSTAAFLAAVEAHGGHVWSVDIEPPHTRWRSHPQWSLMVGDDLHLAAELPDGVDVVFIDTSHHYQQTLDELDAYVPKVKPDGVVLLHDTELEHPPDHLASDPAFPVRVALDDYCAAHDLTPEYVTGCYGLGVIRIPGAPEPPE